MDFKKAQTKAVDQSHRATNDKHDEHTQSLQQTCQSQRKVEKFSRTTHNFLPRINYSLLWSSVNLSQKQKASTV